MNPLLLKAYKAEYENTEISLEKLRLKHKIPPDVDTSSWQKKEESTTDIDTSNQAGTPDLPEEPEQHLVTEQHMLTSKITNFKVKALDHAIECMEDPTYLEVKEFKDLVAVVTNIEGSIKEKHNPATTINVLINNLTERFVDDC